MPKIIVVSEKVSQDQLKKQLFWFKTMVKFVVDVERNVLALGGELHADAEALLLEKGSRQEDLWGANFYPFKSAKDRIEYTSLINIRPSAGNNSMEIRDEKIRERVRALAEKLILERNEQMA